QIGGSKRLGARIPSHQRDVSPTKSARRQPPTVYTHAPQNATTRRCAVVFHDTRARQLPVQRQSPESTDHARSVYWRDLATGEILDNKRRSCEGGQRLAVSQLR